MEIKNKFTNYRHRIVSVSKIVIKLYVSDTYVYRTLTIGITSIFGHNTYRYVCECVCVMSKEYENKSSFNTYLLRM